MAQQDPQSVMRTQNSLWSLSLIILAVLAAISEGVYLGLGSVAYACAANERLCNTPMGAIARPLFETSVIPGRGTYLYSLYSIGLPGLNNLFYLFYGYFDAGNQVRFVETIAISLLVGWLSIFVFLSASRGRGLVLRLILAFACAVGWFVLYNAAELSIFGGSFSTIVPVRAIEIAITTVCLMIASLVVERRHA